MKLNIAKKFEIDGDSSQTGGFQLFRAGPNDYQRNDINEVIEQPKFQ